MNRYKVEFTRELHYCVNIEAATRDNALKGAIDEVDGGNHAPMSAYTYGSKVYQVTEKGKQMSVEITQYLVDNSEDFVDLEDDEFVVNPEALKKVLDDFLNQV